jgi:hypothetical protein
MSDWRRLACVELIPKSNDMLSLFANVAPVDRPAIQRLPRSFFVSAFTDPVAPSSLPSPTATPTPAVTEPTR